MEKEHNEDVIILQFSPTTQKLTHVTDDDQEEVTISIEAKNDLSQGIRKMEEEKYSKTLPKKTRRRRENDNEVNIDNLIRIIEDDLEDENKKKVDDLRKILGAHQLYHRVCADSTFRALSHGKWLVKPENWPKEIDFIDPNNGAVIGGKKKKTSKAILEEMYTTFKKIYREKKTSGTAEEPNNKVETGCDGDSDSDCEDYKTDLVKKLCQLKKNSFDVDVQLDQLIALFPQHEELPEFIYAVTKLVSTMDQKVKQENWGSFKQACQKILKRNWSTTTTLSAKKRKGDVDFSAPSSSKQLNIEPREDSEGYNNLTVDILSRAMEGNISQADDPSKFGITEPDDTCVPYMINYDGALKTDVTSPFIQQDLYFCNEIGMGNPFDVSVEGNDVKETTFGDIDIPGENECLPLLSDLTGIDMKDLLSQ